MLKRIFLLFFGLGLGLFVGAMVMRRLDEAADAVAPGNLAQQAGRAAGSFAGRLREAWAETQVAAHEREAELRAEYNVPSARDLIDRS